MNSIRIGIFGYGNLGRGVEAAIRQNEDMELAAVFTRRDPSSVAIQTENVPVVKASEVEAWKDRIDVMILCGGSFSDLPTQTPALAAMFNVVDSFDTHANISEHFAKVDAAAISGGHAALISAGWDPGLFSLVRALGHAFLPQGKDYTFWGKGVSQGHSDAVRRIPGVKNAKQYTIPVDAALDAVRSGSLPELTTRQKHVREVFAVLEEGADAEAIKEAIVTMPHYFDEYDTTVHFIDEATFARDHSGMNHGGFVMRSGKTGAVHNELMELRLTLDSNPEFTGSILTAYARAIKRMSDRGQQGCFTVYDVAPGLLLADDPADMRKNLL